MLKHFLVTWDNSAASKYLLAYVVSMAKLVDARLTLLHLPVQPSVTPEPQAIDPMSWHVSETEAEAGLDKIVSRLQAEHLTVQKAILESAQPEYLTRYAHQQGVDLIAIANRKDNISDSLYNLMAATDIPLLIIHPDQTPPEAIHYQKLLVPLDGSQRAECVLPLSIHLAGIAQAQLLLAHVVGKPEIPRYAQLTPEEAALAEQVIERNRAEADKYLEQLRSHLDGNTQSYLRVSDNIVGTLRDLAENEKVDLIVLCAHGYSAEPTLPYGSVTGKFIADSHRPILVVQDLPANHTQPTQAEAFQDRGH